MEEELGRGVCVCVRGVCVSGGCVCVSGVWVCVCVCVCVCARLRLRLRFAEPMLILPPGQTSGSSRADGVSVRTYSC